jgi:hypothetical protein
MWTELIAKIDEMWGAGLLAALGGIGMYLEVSGVVEMCVPGIVALLMAKAVGGK